MDHLAAVEDFEGLPLSTRMRLAAFVLEAANVRCGRQHRRWTAKDLRRESSIVALEEWEEADA